MHSFNEFAKQFKPIGKGITDVFHHIENDVKGEEHLISHSFDNLVNKSASSFDGLTHLLSNPLVIIGAGCVVLFVVMKK